MNATASPLSWPAGWPRTPDAERRRSAFGKWNSKPSLSMGLIELSDELNRLGVDLDDVVISTNLALRLDGLPRSGQATPADPGVAVYWVAEDGSEHVLACDQYDLVGCNLRAIVRTIEATRAITRWGAVSLEQAFRGYAALPDSAGGEAWWTVLGLEAPTSDLVVIRTAYKRFAKVVHPDVGGDIEEWHQLQAAVRQGMAYAGAQA